MQYFAQTIEPITNSPISGGTILGGIAVIISLLISAFGIYRGYKTEREAAKKSEFDTVVANYKELLKEGKERERKLEAIIDRQNRTIERNEGIIDEQKIVIHRLEGENADLKKELERHRKA